jgi:hypothetical protein
VRPRVRRERGLREGHRHVPPRHAHRRAPLQRLVRRSRAPPPLVPFRRPAKPPPAAGTASARSTTARRSTSSRSTTSTARSATTRRAPCSTATWA